MTTVVVLVLAITATGVPVQHVSANNGGVWLVDNSAGTGFAEFNVPIGQLGSHFTDASGTSSNRLDVLQDGTSVVAFDEQKGVVFPVDEQTGTYDPNHSVTLGPAPSSGSGLVGEGQVALGGGTIAALATGDAGKPGRVWAGTVGSGAEPDLSAINPNAKPLVTLPGAQAVAVDDQGDLFVASSTTLVEVPANNTGLGTPTTTPLPRQLGTVQLTTVGTTPVILDPAKGTVAFPEAGEVTQLGVSGSGQLALQQSGPDAPSALIGTSTGLLAIPLGGGSPATLASVPGSGSRPAQPVELDGCAYDAWGGAGAYDVTVCPSAGSTQVIPATPLQGKTPGSTASLSEPVLRVNNGFVVLDDVADGGVWLVKGSPNQVLSNDDWLRIFRADKVGNSNNTQGNPTADTAEKPQLHNPPLYVRANQQSVLHLLDDDTDPNQSPLSITSVNPPPGSGFTFAISPDTQTVVATLTGAPSSVTLQYSVIDGKGQSATGNVTVSTTTTETPPAPIKPQPQLHIVSGGTQTFGVLANWRDHESDPVTLAQVTAPAGQVSWTSDGLVTYTAPTTPTDLPITLTYQVTDGRSAPVPQTQQLVVVGSGDLTPYPAQAQADVAEVVVGKPATVSPLSNDLFGADPADPGAKLVLDPVASVPNVQVSPPSSTGQLTVTATQPGAYLLAYQDAFGSAPPTPPTPILIEAVPPPTAASPPPVTTPVSVLVHGTNATTVDVLASDFDPAGGLLTVTGLGTVPTGISASVQQGEFVRVAATTAPMATPQIVTYEVTNGTQSAEGQVIVTEEPPLPATPPVVPLTHATVRVGNEVDVPVLASASEPDGEPISLVSGASGTGSKEGAVGLSQTNPGPAYKTGLGTATVSGAYLRYVAPAGNGIAAAEQVTASFIVEASDGTRTTGETEITVLPDSTADTAPQPQEVDARVASGGTVTIPIPTTGVDPDGQDVTVTGITSAPALGQVLAVHATSIVYQAYPLASASGGFNGGTDTFSYEVVSPSGQSAQQNIRVGIAPPEAIQPPVAVDHVATGAPGANVLVDLLHGDVVAPGDQVTVEPLSTTNHPVPNGARLVGNGTLLEVKAPSGAVPLTVAYGITDGTGTPSVAHVIVRAEAHYQPAPVASDYYPKLPSPSAKKITVNVLAKDSDPAGARADLVVTGSPVRHTAVKGSKIVVPVNPSPMAVPYTIESKATKEASVGVIHVPGSIDAFRLSGGVIHVPKGGSKTVDLTNYVSEPGHTVRITATSAVQASPAFGLTEQVTGNTAVTLTGVGTYQGPGSLVVQMTDTTSLSTPGAHARTLAIPVVVGKPTAIVRCPPTPIDLVQGGRTIDAKVSSLCQVWTPEGTSPSSVSFTESWAKQAPGVNLSTSHSGQVVTLGAASSATAGASGQLTVGVPGGGAEASSTLDIVVVPAPPATVNPVTIPGVETGHSVTVDMSQYVDSPLARPRVSVLGVSPTGGSQAHVSYSGSTITLTPQTGRYGTETFTVSVTDQGKDRAVQGTITLQVLDKPTAPTGLQCVAANQQLSLTWGASQPNGAPVGGYTVAMQGGGTRDVSGTAYTWIGLTNGTGYTFSVKAQNQVGTSDPSASVSCSPKAVPDAPVDVTGTGGNGQVALNWTPPNDNGQPIIEYTVTATPSAGGASSHTTQAPSLIWTGLDNNIGPYTFTVTARNSVGIGPPSQSRPVYAHAQPPQPAAPTASAAVSPDQATTTITVTWPQMTLCNDAQPCSSYVVTELKGGVVAKTQTTPGGCGGSASTCSALFGSIANDGADYTYQLQAINQEGDKSPTSALSNDVRAIGKTGQITDLSGTPQNSSAIVKFSLPAPHGAAIAKVDYSAVSSAGTVSGSWPISGPGGTPETETIPNLSPKATYSVTVMAENESGPSSQGPPSNALSVTPYGTPDSPSMNAPQQSGSSVVFSWSGGGNEGLPLSPIAPYTYSIVNGPQHVNTTTASVSVGNRCGQSYLIQVWANDTANQTSNPPASQSASTVACPPPVVSIYQGGPKQTSYCTSGYCDAIVVQLSNFNPNEVVTVYYSTDCSSWVSNAASCFQGTNQTPCGPESQTTNYQCGMYQVDGSGNATISDRAFGWPGAHVWVSARAPYPSGIASNTIQWAPAG